MTHQLIQRGILDWILEQKNDKSGKIDEIGISSVVYLIGWHHMLTSRVWPLNIQWSNREGKLGKGQLIFAIFLSCFCKLAISLIFYLKIKKFKKLNHPVTKGEERKHNKKLVYVINKNKLQSFSWGVKTEFNYVRIKEL